MTFGFDFHPEARAELFADVDWYDEREAGAGERFEAAVRAAIDAAVESPESCAVWPAGRANRSFEPRVSATSPTGSSSSFAMTS
jgi:hypothetical protein